MDYEALMEQIKKQPFFVVNDEAYARMLKKLQDGEPFVKTFPTTCRHTADKCSCMYFSNTLHEGGIVRKVSMLSDPKPVISLSMLKNGY